MLPENILPLLGLARRAGKIVIGHDAVRRVVREHGREILLIFAEDVAAAARRRVLYGATDVRQLTAATKQEWGNYWGRPEVGVFAVTDKNFAQGIFDKAGTAQDG
ncbi:hypothetical protein EDS67_05580 [candidate division KSB1 bacterium]|nr:MAG: hypothetical protein EDS67_05580 [candidate division KSB1 bacterium]MBC6949805.1 hypothetical protein [candidate division KSB1 bacterium]MCE7940387.1 hypothetical protein [Chlorobi bacterium CHB1]MDL1877101.1 hypothetical protein [Cytophagia bacterium CHB2]